MHTVVAKRTPQANSENKLYRARQTDRGKTATPSQRDGSNEAAYIRTLFPFKGYTL